MPIWYQYYFQIERGRAGLAANRRDIAQILWKQWSPNWHFDDARFERTAAAFDNPDYVDVVIHSYRHRYGLAESDPRYADIQRRLAALPAITVPAITLDGDGDGVCPRPTASASAAKFTGRRAHRMIPRAGHNLPQEEPEAFAAAVMELIGGQIVRDTSRSTGGDLLSARLVGSRASIIGKGYAQPGRLKSRAGVAARSGWSRCAMSMPTCSMSRTMKRGRSPGRQ